MSLAASATISLTVPSNCVILRFWFCPQRYFRTYRAFIFMYGRSSSVSVLELKLGSWYTSGEHTIGCDGSSTVNKLPNGDGGIDARNYRWSALVSLLPLCSSLTPQVARHSDGIACVTWELPAYDERALDCWKPRSVRIMRYHTICIPMGI